MTAQGLVDGHGRRHRDLRISLTDHCNLRCTYCMPAEGVPWLPRNTLLDPGEILRITRAFVDVGVEEVRLTGGEPLLRRDLLEIVSGIASLDAPGGPVDLSMTTNGIGLDTMARDLADAGLNRINISLDTLDAERFTRLARRDRIGGVLAGIEAAISAGLRPVKLNSVLMRGINDDEAPQLLRFALDKGIEVRFIEQMPLDGGHTWTREGMVTANEVQSLLEADFALTPLPGRGAAPAERFLVDGGPATVGIIASVTRPFCGACDRIRLTADGQLRNCLFARTETDLRTRLRSGATDQDLTDLLRASLAAKLPGHGINDPGFLQPQRPMSAIGG